jgi:hypothetical protein
MTKMQYRVGLNNGGWACKLRAVFSEYFTS